MSLLTLPPIWKRWTQEDLEHLTADELDELWRCLHLNEMLILDRYDYETIFKKRGLRTSSSMYNGDQDKNKNNIIKE